MCFLWHLITPLGRSKKAAGLRTLWGGKMPVCVTGFIKLTLPALHLRGDFAPAAELSCAVGIRTSARNGRDFPSFTEDRSAMMCSRQQTFS